MLRKSLAQLFLEKGSEGNFWGRLVRSHINHEANVLDQLKAGFESQDLPIESDVEGWIAEWRSLIAAQTVAMQHDKDSKLQWLLADRARQLSLFPFWPGFQLLEVMKAFSCYLSSLPFSISKPVQLDSGAVPRESGLHWEQGAQPHLLWQADLGQMWALAGRLMGREDLLRAAEKVGEWQLNALDAHYRPFRALYAREGEVKQSALFQGMYGLFHALALFSGRGEWEYVAGCQLALLEGVLEEENGHLDPERVLLVHWLECNAPVPQPHYVPRTKVAYDGALGFGSHRSQDVSLCVSGDVAGASVASYCGKEVAVVSMGPQGGDLGDCRHFGLWTDKSGVGYSETSDGFQLRIEGRSGRFVEEEKAALYGRATLDPCWFKLVLEKQADLFSVEAEGLQLPIYSSPFYFSFFVRGTAVQVGGQQLNLRSLERYSGEGALVSVVAEGEELILHCAGKEPWVEVIPLAGGDSFWGADFLLAYPLTPLASQKWELQVVSRSVASVRSPG